MRYCQIKLRSWAEWPRRQLQDIAKLEIKHGSQCFSQGQDYGNDLIMPTDQRSGARQTACNSILELVVFSGALQANKLSNAPCNAWIRTRSRFRSLQKGMKAEKLPHICSLFTAQAILAVASEHGQSPTWQACFFRTSWAPSRSCFIDHSLDETVHVGTPVACVSLNAAPRPSLPQLQLKLATMLHTSFVYIALFIVTVSQGSKRCVKLCVWCSRHDLPHSARASAA